VWIRPQLIVRMTEKFNNIVCRLKVCNSVIKKLGHSVKATRNSTAIVSQTNAFKDGCSKQLLLSSFKLIGYFI